MNELPDKQENNRNEDGTFKKGMSGNLQGRPKGKTLKEWVREKLANMTDEQREEFLKDIPKEIHWRMAEGNPPQSTDITSKGEKIFVLPSEIIQKNELHTDPSPKGDSSGQSQV